MDPYRILGITRSCTRQEAKAAFRAKAWQMHPDHGGSDQDFIELEAAYRRVLRELELAPAPRPWPAGGSSAAGRGTYAPAYSEDADWAPEIIVLGTAPPPARAARAPVPDWDPEMVLHDEPPRPAQPFDPGWDPEIVLLDEPSQPIVPPDWEHAEHAADLWLERLAGMLDHARAIFGSTGIRAILTMMLLVLIVLILVVVGVIGVH